MVLGVKGKDMLIEHSSEDQLYEINGPKKKYSSLLHLASILKIVKNVLILLISPLRLIRD